MLGNVQAGAIVILSGGQNETAREYGDPVSEKEQFARIRYGVFLHRKTGLPLLVSGGSVYGLEKRGLADTMRYDFESGFGGKVNWLETKSRTSAENAVCSYEILAA